MFRALSWFPIIAMGVFILWYLPTAIEREQDFNRRVLEQQLSRMHHHHTNQTLAKE